MKKFFVYFLDFVNLMSVGCFGILRMQYIVLFR